MCGRIASTLSNAFLRRFFRTEGDAPALAPRWNLAPGQNARVVRRLIPQAGIRGMAALRWGLIPHSTDILALSSQPAHVEAETLVASSLFGEAFDRRRCLVPAEVFYEWQAVQGGLQPHAVARLDGAPLALGAIWEGWLSPDGEPVRSFALVTTPANTDLRPVSDRMPLVVQAEDWPLWLGETRADATRLLRPAPAGVLMAWPVSERIDSLLNNDATLIEPVRPERAATEAARV
ncbi:SOS response-associated peptidase [Acidisoma cladoniae]|jgi:putative SOS response-associated peptidase YedK|uniref:SOS response-associated peptidase n=1 Tax=Acidisoma cladoniae TaxID=3040935 RepID=UPI00254BD1E1|nr:SOS response-associated peptidase [Acidisoma sp. PAMC 29798]